MEDGVKTEVGAKTKDGKLVDDVKYFYIGGKHKNVIDKSFKLGLKDGDLHLKNFDNRQLRSTKIVNKYLGEKDIDADNRLFNFEKSIKNLENIAEKINMIIDYYKPKTK